MFQRLRFVVAAAAASIVLPSAALANRNPVAIPAGVQFAANGMPILHSNPDAAGAAFIDFDGGTWSSTTYLPYGSDSTFSAQEAKDIYNAWLDISTHFAMFDINVTTVQPDKWTTPTAHVLISPSMSGGAANTNVYGNKEVNARGANEASDATNRTTGITHELGHIMGLNHQSSYDANGVKTASYRGTDAYNRAPIMGVDFAGKFSHWANGTSSVSSTTIQNDLQVLANNIVAKANSFANNTYTGDGYRIDEHGNTRPAATPLDISSATPSGANYLLTFNSTGIIERYSDTDMFAFNWAGSPSGQSVSFVAEAVKNVAASPLYGSSLGMILSVYNSQGLLLGQNPMSDPADALANLTLANLTDAGTYYLSVQSHGEYEDLGAYTLQFSGVTTEILAPPLIPEPTSLALLGLGGLFIVRRRRD